MSIYKRSSIIISLLIFFTSTSTIAAETHTINAQARRFVPDILQMQPGDSAAWMNMTSHDTVSIEGLIPEGAKPWRGKIGENFHITLEKEGIYAYVCEPHLGFGMVGLVIVGKPTNLAAIKAAALKLQGPYRRILGKIKKVKVPAPK